jgi:Flp pilus assembly protein TadD
MGWYGIYLSDIGEFAKAAELLEQATGKAPEEAWLFFNLGWALQHRDEFAAERARRAYETSVSLEPSNSWYRKGLAESLFLAGDKETASKAFEDLIRDMTFVSAQGGPDILYLLGWCQYRQARYDEAMRLFQLALSRDYDLVGTNFDLALATLCSGRVELAMREYENSLNRCSSAHVLRQRGLLYVALFDLVVAAKNGSIVAGAERVFSRLRERSAAVGLDLGKQIWLPEHVSARLS